MARTHRDLKLRPCIYYSTDPLPQAIGSLMRHKQGDLLLLQGTGTQSHCTGKDGEDRTRLSVNVGSIVSARTARPGGKRKNPSGMTGKNIHLFNEHIL